MAHERELVLVVTGDAEVARQHLGGLAHVQLAHRIGEPELERDHRLEVRRPEGRDGAGALAERPGAGQADEQLRHPGAVDERNLAHRLGAARDDESSAARQDLEHGGRDRLHARGAVAMHRVRDAILGQARLKADHTGDVRRMRRLGDVAEDDLVDARGIDPAAGDQLAHHDRSEVVGAHLPHHPPCLAEGRAEAVQDGHALGHRRSLSSFLYVRERAEVGETIHNQPARRHLWPAPRPAGLRNKGRASRLPRPTGRGRGRRKARRRAFFWDPAASGVFRLRRMLPAGNTGVACRRPRAAKSPGSSDRSRARRAETQRARTGTPPAPRTDGLESGPRRSRGKIKQG